MLTKNQGTLRISGLISGAACMDSCRPMDLTDAARVVRRESDDQVHLSKKHLPGLENMHFD